MDNYTEKNDVLLEALGDAGISLDVGQILQARLDLIVAVLVGTGIITEDEFSFVWEAKLNDLLEATLEMVNSQATILNTEAHHE